MSPRAMRRYVFEEVTHRAVKSMPCPGCGKNVRRARTFMNTLNPFNVDPTSGEPRTYSQIVDKLQAEAGAWQREPERCTACLRLASRPVG